MAFHSCYGLAVGVQENPCLLHVVALMVLWCWVGLYDSACLEVYLGRIGLGLVCGLEDVLLAFLWQEPAQVCPRSW